MFARIKKSGRHEYLQIVANHKERGKVRQQVIATLGRMDEMRAKGRIETLIRSLARFSQAPPGEAQGGQPSAAWLRKTIQDYVAGAPENRMGTQGAEPIFDSPLVGFSNGADPLYDEYVRHIGAFYMTPRAIFRRAFPEAGEVEAEELTVVSWILPSTAATRGDHAAESRTPCERWARTRHFGEKVNDALRRQVVQCLFERGIPAVAPVLAPFWSRSDQGLWAPCSNWSERHAAYAAGLGTFGLCDGLITPVGKAIRSGSVVMRLRLPPTPRPYRDRHAYCLFFSRGTCGKCIPRCPAGALSHAGHDKQRCLQYTEKAMNAYLKTRFGIDTYACGLCQTGVPCTDHIPRPEEGE